MGLLFCPECGIPVSTDGPDCPRCGFKDLPGRELPPDASAEPEADDAESQPVDASAPESRPRFSLLTLVALVAFSGFFIHLSLRHRITTTELPSVSGLPSKFVVVETGWPSTVSVRADHVPVSARCLAL